MDFLFPRVRGVAISGSGQGNIPLYSSDIQFGGFLEDAAPSRTASGSHDQEGLGTNLPYGPIVPIPGLECEHPHFSHLLLDYYNVLYMGLRLKTYGSYKQSRMHKTVSYRFLWFSQ